MTFHSTARFRSFRSAVRWLLIDFFRSPSASFPALYFSISAGPIASSFIAPKNGQDVTENIGDVVCAFANTFGGLLFVGVKEENTRPTEIAGVPKARGDLKTQLANMIQAAVYPRPPFSIHVVSAPAAADREVAIVRVAEGDWPPYMWIKERKNKVSIRVQDKCEPASYSDLESLFRRRDEAGPTGLSSRPLPEKPELRASVPGSDKKPEDSKTFTRLWIRPARPVSLVLDGREESDVRRILHQTFRTNDLNVVRRDAASFDVKVGSGWSRLFWRSCDDGTQGVAARWFQSLRAAHIILEERGWLGSVQVQSDLVLGEGRISAGVFEKIDLDGLVGVDEAPAQRAGFSTGFAAGHSELAEPSSLVADLLVRHLREQRGFAADLEQLRASVARLAQAP